MRGNKTIDNKLVRNIMTRLKDGLPPKIFAKKGIRTADGELKIKTIPTKNIGGKNEVNEANKGIKPNTKKQIMMTGLKSIREVLRSELVIFKQVKNINIPNNGTKNGSQITPIGSQIPKTTVIKTTIENK